MTEESEKLEETINKSSPSTFKKKAILFGAIFSLSITVIYESIVVPITHTWNPIKQIKYMNANINANIKKMNEQHDKYDKLYIELLNYADKDRNGFVDFSEQVNAWKAMGYEGPYIESEGANQFKTPEIKNLIKGIESYKTK